MRPRNRHNTHHRPSATSTRPAPVSARQIKWLAGALLALVLLLGVATSAWAKNLTASSWDALPAAEKKHLQPLQDAWQNMKTQDRAKWLELSKNYPTLPKAQQKRMHKRMLEWVEMTPAQRSKAREAFLKSQGELATADRKAQWEAYQALSAEEKKRLSEQAKKKQK